MVLFDIAGFFKENEDRYKDETSEAKGIQDHVKIFNEQLPREVQLENALRSMLVDYLSGDYVTRDEFLANSGSSQTSGPLTGTVQEQFWQFYTQAGYSKAAVAGMMGNIRHESLNWKTNAEEMSGPKEGYGLIQWSFGRKDALFAHAKKQGKPKDDFQMQLEYLQMELEGLNGVHNHWITNGYNGRYSYDEFKQTNNVSFATDAFCWAFLRPSIKHSHIDRRKKYAEEYYNEFKNYQPSNAGATGTFTNPADGRVTSPFGMRTHPIHRDRRMHNGIDVAGGGTQLLAAETGVVTINKWHNSLGWYVKLNHGTINGKQVDTLYAHLAKQSHLKLGSTVHKGMPLGTMGTTGSSTGVHLHFEVHENNKPVDPKKYVTYRG